MPNRLSAILLIGLALGGCMSRAAEVSLPQGHPARPDTAAATVPEPTALRDDAASITPAKPTGTDQPPAHEPEHGAQHDH